MLEVRSQGLEGERPALWVAWHWARSFLISKRGFEAAVSDITPEPVELIRVRWRGRTRRIIVRQAFTDSRARTLQEPLTPSSFDPWTEFSESLAVKTRQLSRCRICGGEKRVPCPACRGAATISCEHCNGSGSIWSPRSRRMIGCRACHGTGAKRCACRDGLLACGPCGGKGKVEEWLEVMEESFDRITSAGSPLLVQAMPERANPEKFDSELQYSTVPLFLAWKGRTVEEAPAELQSVLRRPDLSCGNAGEDRLQEIALQVFRSEVTTVSYQLGGIRGSVQVQGWDARVVENAFSREPFQRRQRRALQGMSVAFLAGAALAIWYAGRHSFFVSTPNYGQLWVLAFVLGLCFVPLMFWWVLPARGRRWRGAVGAGLPALLVVLTQAGVAATGGPSLDHARAAATRGRVEDALRESAACYDLGIQAQPAGSFHDQLQLERVRQAREPQEAWKAASLPFLTPSAREEAKEHAVETTFRASAALQEKGELSASAALLDSAPAELKQAAPLVDLRRRVYLEEALPFWKVIGSRRKSLEDKLAACIAITPHLRGLASLPAATVDSSLTAEEVKEECGRLQEQRLREIEREREAEAREAARARRREEASRESAQRRWSSARLRCNDGTLSPSCVCGGSHRGCCSWHGGVDGCSAPYPN